MSVALESVIAICEGLVEFARGVSIGIVRHPYMLSEVGEQYLVAEGGFGAK